jgi:ureidoacrylate peracid hydrolase
VLVIDMQNDFGAPGGMFARAGIDIGAIRAAVAPTARVLAAARAARMAIVYLKMGFRPDLSDLGAADAPNRIKHRPLGVGDPVRSPDGRASRTLVRDTWSTDVLDELAPEPGDAVVWKTRYSGFFETELDALLRGRGVRSLIVTGCTTSVCVESTIRDAMFRDYACLLLEDCTAEPVGSDLPRTNHEASLLILQGLFAWVTTSDEVVTSLRRG